MRILFFILLFNYAYAINVFKPIGFKATGMGGVGTANSTGTFAAYYNPALLPANPVKSEYALGLGVSYRENNIAENLDALADANFDETIENIADNAGVDYSNSSKDIANLKSVQDIFSSLSSTNGLSLSVSPYFSTQITNNFAVGVFSYIDASISINAEEGYTEFIFSDGSGNYYSYDPDTDTYSISTLSDYESSSIEYAINNGLLEVEAKATMLIEVPLTFAEVSQAINGYFAYGANVKLMAMNMIDKTISLGSGSDGVEDVAEDSFDEDFDQKIGIDLGFAYQPKKSGTIVGLMIKNLNSPTFDVSGEELKLERAIRVGVSQQFLYDMAEVAIDVDLTENDSLIDDDKSQYISGGIEFHPTSWFSLRTGIMKDIATDVYDEGFVYTAGLGFGLKWGQFDISAMMSEKSGYYDGDEIPRYMNVNFSFISKWGSR